MGNATRISLVSACILGGILAGTDVYRLVVAFPAWQVLGVVSRADFSRHADLGNGIVVGTTLLTIAALLSLWRDRARGATAAGVLPLLAAAVCNSRASHSPSRRRR